MVQRAPSNTEPLLRLNAEARTLELLADKTAEVLALIRGEAERDIGDRREGAHTVTLDPQLLEILVCPNDRGDLDYREGEQVLVCTTCGYRYRSATTSR